MSNFSDLAKRIRCTHWQITQKVSADDVEFIKKIGASVTIVAPEFEFVNALNGTSRYVTVSRASVAVITITEQQELMLKLKFGDNIHLDNIYTQNDIC